MIFIKAGSGHTMHERKDSSKMNEDNPNIPCGKYSVNMSGEDLANICVKARILSWCKEHPEVTGEAKDYAGSILAQIEKLESYDKNVFPINKSLSKVELDFILNSIKISTPKDFSINQHISNYTYCIKIKDNEVNKGRFAFGSKTKPQKFKELCAPMLEMFSINHKPREGFNYYGIGWDIKENIFKIYELSKDSSAIFCEEYEVNRSSNESVFLKKKLYKVGVETTLMEKDGELIKQINIGQETPNGKESEVSVKFPKAKILVKEMSSLGFVLDTYSVYDDSLNMYFTCHMSGLIGEAQAAPSGYFN
jgi:hypothetical protein